MQCVLVRPDPIDDFNKFICVWDNDWRMVTILPSVTFLVLDSLKYPNVISTVKRRLIT